MHALHRALLAAILLIAALARFAALDSVPHAVYFDEAQNANEGIYAVEHAQPKLFYPANNGREGLFINLMGLSLETFGANRFGLRFLSAFVGTLSVALIYLLGRDLLSPSVGLWAAFFLATSFWHLLFSRIAFRAILLPAVLMLAFWCLWRAWRSNRIPWAIAGGLAFGVGAHSYLAFRIAPLIALGWFWLQRRTALHRPGGRLTALWTLTAVLVASPMGLYFLQHPGDLTHRSDQLSILHRPQPAMELVTAILKSAAMFFWKSDCNGWHNLGCDPQLPAPLAGLLLMGVALGLLSIAAMLHFRLPQSLLTRHYPHQAHTFAFLFLWIALMLVPEILSWEGMPHALRSIGTIPPIFLLTAVGADIVTRRFAAQKAVLIPLLAVILGTSAFEFYRYFALWPDNATTRKAASAHLTTIAEYLNALPPETPRFVIANEYGELDPIDPGDPTRKTFTPAQTVIFLTRGHPSPIYLKVDEMLAQPFPPGAVVIPLLPDPRLFPALRERGIRFHEESYPDFIAARIE